MNTSGQDWLDSVERKVIRGPARQEATPRLLLYCSSVLVRKPPSQLTIIIVSIVTGSWDLATGYVSIHGGGTCLTCVSGRRLPAIVIVVVVPVVNNTGILTLQSSRPEKSTTLLEKLYLFHG